MVKFEHDKYLTNDNCGIIIHNFGYNSIMDGRTNFVLNVKYPNIYYNLRLRRKLKRIKIGDFLVTKEENVYFMSMITTPYDYDVPDTKVYYSEKYTYQALSLIIDFIKNFNMANLKIGAPAYFGASDKRKKAQVMKTVEELFKDIDITFYDKI